MSTKRRERLDIASSDQPTLLRVLVAVGLVLLLVLEYRPHLKPVAGLVFMGTLAAVVTSAFLLTVILDYPFAGEVSVSNAPFKQDNLSRFWESELAYRPKPGDELQPLTAQRLAGVYNSTAYGTLVLQCYEKDWPHRVRRCGPSDSRMRGVYRYYDGTLTGEVVGGVFRGWWTQAPTHQGDDAGRVTLRLVKTSDGPLVAGSYGYRFAPPRTPGSGPRENQRRRAAGPVPAPPRPAHLHRAAGSRAWVSQRVIQPAASAPRSAAPLACTSCRRGSCS